MNINIQVIPHSQQRYETVGDWFFDDKGDLQIRVSDLGDWRYNALIAVHEVCEVLLCKHRGITQEMVDKFDQSIDYSNAPEGFEPGDEPDAPYANEHCFATGIERLLAAELNVGWATYDAQVAKQQQ